MSANVESMFYVREKPWHGLGTKVDEAHTSADAIKLAGLDWEVKKLHNYVRIGTKMKAVPGRFSTVRMTDGQILGSVKSRYQIVQNKDAFAFTDELLGEGVKYETAGSLYNGSRVWLLARMENVKILDDAVEPYMLFSNSHDGSAQIKVTMTPVRVVCNNTLSLALNEATNVWSTRHVGNLETKLEDARETLGLAKKYMQELNEEAEQMYKVKLTKDDFIKIIGMLYPVTEDMSSRKASTNRFYQDEMIYAYNQTDLNNIRNTAWGVLNAIADYATHAKPVRGAADSAEPDYNGMLAYVLAGMTILNKTREIILNQYMYR